MKTTTTLAVLTLLVAPGLFAGCGPAPAEADVARVELHLAIEFASDDILEVTVFDAQAAACADLGPSTDLEALDPLDQKAASAEGLNTGALDFSFDELPAEKPLSFYARATDAGGATLADDCATATVPAGGEAQIELVVEAP